MLSQVRLGLQDFKIKDPSEMSSPTKKAENLKKADVGAEARFESSPEAEE
jgi:hypothetical protein